MGGTLTLAGTRSPDPVQRLRTFGRVGFLGTVLCTLLGPEGPGRLIFGSGRSDLLDFVRRHGFGRVGEEYRPYFENYTVDASILKDADETGCTPSGVRIGLSVSYKLSRLP
jgi:hypothetical protein